MQEGIVKWFDNRKGFGFIEPKENGEDLFVHYENINGEEGERVTLDDGQEVTYEVSESEKGLMAVNVTKF